MVHPTYPAPLVPAMTTSEVDPVQEIQKRRAKEFLGDKGDDPTIAEQWLSRLCKVIKELKRNHEDNLRCIVSLLEGESYQWWETLVNVTPKPKID